MRRRDSWVYRRSADAQFRHGRGTIISGKGPVALAAISADPSLALKQKKPLLSEGLFSDDLVRWRSLLLLRWSARSSQSPRVASGRILDCVIRRHLKQRSGGFRSLDIGQRVGRLSHARIAPLRKNNHLQVR